MAEKDKGRTKGGLICLIIGVFALAVNIVPRLLGINPWAGPPGDPVAASGPYVDAFLWVMGVILTAFGALLLWRQRSERSSDR